MTNTRNQDIDNTLKTHEKEQSSKQQEEILKAVRDNSSQSRFSSSFPGGGMESRGAKPLRIGKVEFPKFSGEDVEGWVYRCEHFFTLDETPDETKLRCAVIHLEGDALQWHRAFLKTWNATVSEVPWDDYVRSISSRFSSALFEDPLEEIASLNQTGSLQDLNTAFDSLLNKVTLSETQAVSLYLKALKPEIKGPVKMFKPRTLHEAYRLAKTQALNNENLEEQLNKGKWNAGNTKINNNSRNTPPTNATKLPLLPTPNQPAGLATKPVNGPRRLTSKELEQKRAKGECFWCTEKFVPGHTCARPRKQLYITEAEEDDGEGPEGVIEDEEEEDPQISIHALTGIPSYSTMRVLGSIDSQVPRHVTISSEICKVIGSKLLLPLESYDMILGVQWLLPLHDILWNLQRMTMKFAIEGKQYELKGLQNNLFSVEKMVDRTRQDHIQHLERVLSIMQENKLFAKESKCVFGGRAVEYLGHIISKEGVKTDPGKVEAVQQWPSPKTIKQLRGFFGMAGYYQRFIRSFGMIAKPLTDLLKKDAFRWSPETQDAFERLKRALPGLLQPLPISDMVFSDISMDFIGGLPNVKGNDTIFVVVDRLTKYGHFMTLGHPFSAKDVAQVFLDNVYKLHGCPNSIISDRDPVFLSSFWTEFLHLQGVEAKLSTAYHPQTDGQTEVVNRCLEGYLRCMVMERPHTWVKWVVLAEWWYNTRSHSSLERKLVKRGHRAAMKVLVHWQGQATQDATWEFLEDLKLRFPDFDPLIEGKSG
ncbi:uncharacterized protein LOC143618840 [Bidens hawaiensis]|uniref:uncharacterized protein LOC143618840 n=1 Tax=Bidens hawaiensis TaxID=980011 RepID=UPI00404A59CD